MKLTSDQKSELQGLLEDATSEENVGNRVDLMERYLAEPYGDEVKGRSAFVDSSSSDAVEALLPDIMDVFTSTENICEFSPVGPEDVEAAKQETAAVNHAFWQMNNGFEILYMWGKESMIQQNAYTWAGWVEKETSEIEEYEGLSFEEYQTVISQIEGEYEIQEQSGLTSIEDEATGETITVPELTDEVGPDGVPVPAPIDIRLKCVDRKKEYLIEAFPREDFFLTPRWGKLSLDGAPCCGRAHRNKTKEDWIAFGFSEESLESISQGSDDEEKATRHHTQDVDESEDGTDTLEIFETYVRMDLDGDGAPELVQIWCSEDGGTILEWEDGEEAVKEVGRVPIHALTPYIMPHRHIGRSVVENVDDIQRVKTVLMRQTLDSVYAALYARPHYDENEAGENLEEDLANPSHGAPVRTGGAIVTYPQQGAGAVAATTVPLLEKFDNVQEVRTGATRYNQGLDANSLNKTASGINQIMNASQKKSKLVARTFAETGIRDLMLGVHRDLRAGPMKELMFRMRGEWVSVNPRTWRNRTDMVVNVGMGRGDRDERRAALLMAGQVQRELIAAGSRMVDESRLYNTISDTMATFGVQSIENYFHDPSQMPPPPPPQPAPPDPIMISAQSQAQKMQADAQRDAAKLQAEERERERKHQERMQELRLKEIELTNRIQDDQERLDLERKKAVMKDDLERDKIAQSNTPVVAYGDVTESNP